MPRLVGTLSTPVSGAVRNALGGALAGVTVTVVDRSTGVTATVYSDPELSTVLSPVVSNGKGVFTFYAPAGTYGFTFSDTTAVSLDDVEVAGGVSSRSGAYVPSFVAVTAQNGTTDDTAAVQSVLDQAHTAGGGLVTVPFVTGTVGKPLLSALLVIYSNTELRFHPAVRPIQKTGTNDNMLVNAAVVTTTRILDAAMTATSAALSSATVAALSSGAVNALVGQAVTVQGAGTSGVPLTTTVSAVTGGAGTYGLTLAAVAATTVSGQYAAIGARDSNIKVVGGQWDRQNNTNPGSGDQTKCHLLRFRHVDGLTVAPDDLLSSAVGSKYGISIADCTNFDVPTALSTKHYSDVVHISGPCRNFRIGLVTADLVGDDVISLTARDSTSVITDTAGDITDFTITAAHKKADLGGGLTSGVLKMVAGKTSDGSASYAVKRFTVGTFTGPNTNEAVAYIGDNTGGIIAGRIDAVRSLGGSGGTIDAVYLGGGTLIDLDFGTVECAPDDRGPVRVAGGATGVLGGTLRVRRPIIPTGHTVTSTGCVTVDGQLSRVQVDAGTHKGGSGGSIVHVTNGLTPRASVNRIQIGRAHLEVAAGGSGAGLVRAEDTASTLQLIEISDADVLNANYALGMLATATTIVASNVRAEGASLSSWIRVKSGGSVTLKGASGLDTAIATDTYTVDAGGALYLAARNGSAIVTDPDLLSTGEETIDRRFVSNAGLGGTSGRLWLTYFTARKTETINNVRTLQGSQAAATVTLCRIGIYSVDTSGNLTLVASTANDATLWTGTFSATTKALSSSFSKVAGQRYAIGLLSVATTAPKWVGVAPALGTEDGQAPRLNGNVDSQSDLPASITVGTVANSGGSTFYAALTP